MVTAVAGGGTPRGAGRGLCWRAGGDGGDPETEANKPSTRQRGRETRGLREGERRGNRGEGGWRGVGGRRGEVTSFIY